MTNNNYKVKKHMSAFIENAHEADLWELGDDSITVKATELAMVNILRKLGDARHKSLTSSPFMPMSVPEVGEPH